jgi:glycosyltransferase involved in cell wall biosynthesis
MTENEIISVIIPIYNVERYLDKCIRSVVEQTYKNLEIILVDDGSPDQCGTICDKWAEKDKRIRVIHKTNGGLSDARNAGLDAATGAYIGFVDSDDYIHPLMYQRLYEKVKEYDADLAICGFDWVDAYNDIIIRSANMPDEGLIDKKEALLNMCHYGTFVVVWNKLYKSELFSNLRFLYGKFSEDVFIMHQLFHKCTGIVAVSEYYYSYVQSPNSIMRSEKTVSHLDSVEAYYRMLLFCESNNYPDLLQKISFKMTYRYIQDMEKIKNILPGEKQRIREIKKMVLYGVTKYGQSVRIVHKLYLISPTLYRFLLRVKMILFQN